MVTDTLVEESIEDGRRLLARLAAADFDVRAAFWAKPRDDDRWRLYIVSPALNAIGILGSYRIVVEQFRKLGSAWFDSADVKLVDDTTDVAATIFELQRRFPDATRLQEPLISGLPFEEVYLYQRPTVEVPIYGMTYRESPESCLHLSFVPHDPGSYLEVQAPGMPPRRFPAVTGIDSTIAAPSGSKIEVDERGMTVLSWNFRGRRIQSNAQEIHSLAKLGLHGFRIVSEKN